MKERLEHIAEKMARRNQAVFYVWHDPKAQFMYDTEDATEDVQWLIAEVERLRLQVNDLSGPRVPRGSGSA